MDKMFGLQRAVPFLHSGHSVHGQPSLIILDI
jgi:hypothetical protein